MLRLLKTSMLRINKFMIAKNKNQHWKQANQWLLKTYINAKMKQMISRNQSSMLRLMRL